jgi:hypothetical protein
MQGDYMHELMHDFMCVIFFKFYPKIGMLQVGKVVLSLDKVLVKVEVLVKGEVLVMVVGKVLLMFGVRMNVTVLRIRVLQGILVIMKKVIMKAIMALGEVSIIEVISNIVHTVNSNIMVAVTVVMVVIVVDFMLVATPVTIQMSQQMMGLGMSLIKNCRGRCQKRLSLRQWW